MRKVFLSYSSSDQKVAESIASKLNSYGIDVWRDRDRLYAGQEWREGIEKAIASSVAVVVLVSPRSLRAPYVTFEWAYALGNGARVIPVLIEPTPDTDRHPIATLHYLSLDFTNPSVEELVEEINRPDSDGLGRFLAQDFGPSYRTDLEECEELWLVGVSLRDTIKDLGGVLRRKLAARLLKGGDRWYESFSRELLALWRDGRPPQTPAQ